MLTFLINCNNLSIFFIVKLFCFLNLFSTELKPLINCIEQDWINSKTENERKLMTPWAEKCRKVSILYVFLSQSTFVFYTTQQLSVAITEWRSDWTNMTRTTYVEAYFPYDVNKSPNFQLTWLMQCLSVQLANIAFAFIDSFFAILILHLCGQFRVLRQRVLECVEETDRKFCNWKWHKKVSRIVQRHEHLNK